MVMRKRVLITGSRGFTGRYLADELRGVGWEVSGLGPDAANDDSHYRCANLTDVTSLRSAVAELQPDVVIHLAAISFVGYGDAEAFYKVNLFGTRNLLQVLADMEKRPECVLLASSANIYGNAIEGMLSETTLPNPINDYAVSKLAMEYMARLWLDKLPIIIARPFNYTGVGQNESFLLPKIVAHYRRRAEVIELGNLDIWRDFSDVRAVVQAYRCLIEIKPIGQTVNVCSGRTHSLREVLTLTEAITGHRMRVETNPAFVRPNEINKLCGDSSKLRSLIGHWETPPLEETLRWMLGEDVH